MRSAALVAFTWLALASTTLAQEQPPEAGSEPARSPRVALVVAGDPAEATSAAAARLEESLAAGGALTLPSDAATRAALRGGEGTPEDGLDELRGLRRRLGITADGDRELLATLGERLELVVIVVVRGAVDPTAKVYDVNAARYFAGEAALDVASVEVATQFVVARAEAADQRRRAPPPDATAAAATPPPARATADPTAPVDAPPPRSFMRRNWPFFVAGVLLVGTTTFFLVQRGRDDTSPPVIHIRPGGN